MIFFGFNILVRIASHGISLTGKSPMLKEDCLVSDFSLHGSPAVITVQASKIAAGFIAALLLLVLWWSRKIFTVIMSLIFVALIIACYFIPQPAGGEIMRYFVLFIG